MIERENVDKLIDYIGETLEPYLDNALLDFETSKENIRKAVDSFFGNVKNQSGIEDYKVVSCDLANWESYYPSMPERLLAIEAVDFIGNSLEVNAENAQLVKGYPYQIVSNIVVTYNDGCRDYFSLYEYDDIKNDLKPHSIAKFSRYKIDDPDGVMTADILVKPIKPIQYHEVTIRKPDGMTLEEFDKLWKEVVDEVNLLNLED